MTTTSSHAATEKPMVHHEGPATGPRPSTPRDDSHARTYPQFLLYAARHATEGSLSFYVWMLVLTAVALVGLNTWADQVAIGMAVTHMSDHVSWGLYIANFTFFVGLAAGAVMMVIPAYLYHNRAMHDLVIIGEVLAVASVTVALLFVIADLGRPDRLWHMVPGLGEFNWPLSMLTWDVVVLAGYLLINLHITGYVIYMRWLGRVPERRWYVPVVLLSIIWAISIHTVTAFLYAGLGGRPFWNSALLAPRFIASAFVTGPAFVILALEVARRITRIKVGEGVIRTLRSILQVTLPINLFMLLAELFTEFYTGGSHTDAARYLYVGLHGHHELVPWIWTAIALNVGAAVVLLTPSLSSRPTVLRVGLMMTFVGIWIEKGMGLIVPGFVPSTLHEIVPYGPSIAEWKIVFGIVAVGLIVFTLGLKMAIPGLVPQEASTREPIEDASPAREPEQLSLVE